MQAWNHSILSVVAFRDHEWWLFMNKDHAAITGPYRDLAIAAQNNCVEPALRGLDTCS